jgi:hypothetical protein
MKTATCNFAAAPNNRPALTSPVAGFDVHAILDQDSSLIVGLMVGSDGRRAVLMCGAESFRPGPKEEFARWAQSLRDVAAVSHASEVVAAGSTYDGRAYLACGVEPSMADRMRLGGQPNPQQVRHIGATVADVLATAHSYGLTHGAVSPATVMIDGDRVRLGGFGVTAPGLAASPGLWAFTSPEHRQAALDGEPATSAGGDVFALAATMCVALIGAVPWSQPATWADEAGLPTGGGMPEWVASVRDALGPAPDHRPNAEEFAASLRNPDETVDVAFHGARVDLRPLLPRRIRRLAAYSIAAMTDEASIAHGRAAVPLNAVAGPRKSAPSAAGTRMARPRSTGDGAGRRPADQLPKRAPAANS